MFFSFVIFFSKGCSSGCVHHTLMAKVGGCLSPGAQLRRVSRAINHSGAARPVHIIQPHGPASSSSVCRAVTSDELLDGCGGGSLSWGNMVATILPYSKEWSHIQELIGNTIGSQEVIYDQKGEVHEIRRETVGALGEIGGR